MEILGLASFLTLLFMRYRLYLFSDSAYMQIRHRLLSENTQKENILSVIVEGLRTSVALVDLSIQEYFDKFVQNEDRQAVFKRLSYFAIMHNGYIYLDDKDSDHDVVNAGFAIIAGREWLFCLYSFTLQRCHVVLQARN